jgi:hypothetical protein
MSSRFSWTLYTLSTLTNTLLHSNNHKLPIRSHKCGVHASVFHAPRDVTSLSFCVDTRTNFGVCIADDQLISQNSGFFLLFYFNWLNCICICMSTITPTHYFDLKELTFWITCMSVCLHFKNLTSAQLC